MAMCKDPSLTFLNERGYNVVRLPRAGIGPLDVLGRDGKSVERLGRLGQIWESTIKPPAPNPPQPAASINGEKTANLKLSLGLKFLSNVLGAMGAAIPQVNFAYKRARSVQFTMTNVQSHGVDPFKIGAFLAAGDLDEANPFVSRYFDDDDTHAFVISEVLLSDSINTTAKDSSGNSVEVDVLAIQEVVGAKVSVETAAGEQTTLTYKGQIPLAFGFKAFGIGYADGDWNVQGVKPSEGMAFAVPGATAGDLSPVLFSDFGRVAVRGA